MKPIADPVWVRRTEHELHADPTRVVTMLFLPGQELAAPGLSRSSAVIQRVMALDEEDVEETLADIVVSYSSRHGDLLATLDAHADLVAHRLPDAPPVSVDRRRLIGAYFTQEYSVEAAALFNPSMVAHPDQSGLAQGVTRFVMSVRAVGEGHISSVEFRTGTIGDDGEITVDPVGHTTVRPVVVPTTYSKDGFERQHAELGGEQSNSDFVLDALPSTFDRADLDRALRELRAQRLTRGTGTRTIDRFEWIASCHYSIEFPAESTVAQRVVMPRSSSERHGLEDARFARFVEDDGRVEYRATYTAFDGSKVVPQLLRTDDFRTFHVSQLSGGGAKNKGMALFPRKVGGSYLAVSRADRESNALTRSDDLSHWHKPTPLQMPAQSWEIVQLGNCGPPIETEAGWLVLTHGVGPMREYGIGAILLDLEEPSKVIGSLARPMITAQSDERDGYVPNVVYSCGGMLHGDTLVVPYGCSDSFIRIALVDVPSLLDELHR